MTTTVLGIQFPDTALKRSRNKHYVVFHRFYENSTFFINTFYDTFVKQLIQLFT